MRFLGHRYTFCICGGANGYYSECAALSFSFETVATPEFSLLLRRTYILPRVCEGRKKMLRKKILLVIIAGIIFESFFYGGF